jgi:amidase
MVAGTSTMRTIVASISTAVASPTPNILMIGSSPDPAAWWSPPTPSIPLARALTMASPAGLRIAALTDPPIDGLSADPACVAAVNATLRTLESAGHHAVDASLPLPPTDILIAAFTNIWNVGGAGIALADPSRVEPHNRALREPNSSRGASSKPSSPASTSS